MKPTPQSPSRKREDNHYKTFSSPGSWRERTLNIKKDRRNRLNRSILGILTSVYLWCEVLQLSRLIKSSDHQPINITNYAYDLLFVWMISYTLIQLADIDINLSITRCGILTYTILAHIGGLGFALLGEIPGLNIVITKDWWRYLTIADIVAIAIIGIPIVALMIRECLDSIKRKQFKRQILQMLAVAMAYSGILALLIINKATSLHFHVHHAIFAGVLSLWFVEWERTSTMVVHALMMGVVTEGINFFGVGELFLFLCKGSPAITLTTSLIIASIFCIFLQGYNCIHRPEPPTIDPSEQSLLAYISDEETGETVV